MRAVLWLAALFGIASASALFASENPGTVTLFWPPYRIDVSLNLALLALAACFVLLHLALRGFFAFANIPAQARRWRLQQKERLVQTALVEALMHLVAGRFVRSRKAAEHAIALKLAPDSEDESPARAMRLQSMLHLLAAESAHALQDRTVRDGHFDKATEVLAHPDGSGVHEGLYLRAARWALDDHDAANAMQWLDRLPQGAARRTVALRLRFRVSRMQGQTAVALETARLLIKHRAIAAASGVSITQALALELLLAAKDPAQISHAWSLLDAAERALPDVALGAARHWLAKAGEAAQSRLWLLPVWERMVSGPQALTDVQRLRLVRVLEAGFSQQDGAPDAKWLARIESAQMADPRDALLQYLAGVMCARLSLWGKAQHLLRQCIAVCADLELKQDAQRALDAVSRQRT
ncbi:MAG: heme biosynthesis HemY N-terminal domain-containing protein [Betaproteobacteria bacterium]